MAKLIFRGKPRVERVDKITRDRKIAQLLAGLGWTTAALLAGIMKAKGIW